MSALLALGLLLGTAPIPVYPGTVHTPIGAASPRDAATAAGQLAWFVTADPVESVAAYFSRRWRAEGLAVVTEGDLLAEGVVTAFHTRTLSQRSVVLRRLGRRTLGLASIRALPPATDRQPEPGERSPRATLGSPGDGQVRWERGRLEEIERRLDDEATAAGLRPEGQPYRVAEGVLLEHSGPRGRRWTAALQWAPGWILVFQGEERE